MVEPSSLFLAGVFHYKMLALVVLGFVWFATGQS